MRALRLILFAIFLIPLLLRAHGDLHERIAECTRRIQRQPQRADLYLERAEWHRLHGEWDAALADCDRAGKLDPKLAAVQLVRGQIFFDAGKLEPARTALDAFLTAQPRHPAGHLARARVLVGLKQFSAAELEFTAAINHSPDPEPDHFLERARVQIEQDKAEAALAGLDEGIRRLGPIVSLELRAIELELGRKRFEGALARVDTMLARPGRKESPLVLRGEILERAGRRSEARLAFLQAQEAIASLPASHRETKAVKELESKIKAALQSRP